MMNVNNNRRLRFLKHCTDVAKTSTYHNQKVGCIVEYKGCILSTATNGEKTHTVQKKYNRFRPIDQENIVDKVHAECATLSKIRYLDIDFSRVVVYVSRIKRDGSNGLARPCSACMEYIKSFGIKTIVYTTDYGFAEEKIT